MIKYLHVMIVKTWFVPFICESAYNLIIIKNCLRKTLEIVKLQLRKNAVEEFSCIYIFCNNKLKQFCL